MQAPSLTFNRHRLSQAFVLNYRITVARPKLHLRRTQSVLFKCSSCWTCRRRKELCKLSNNLHRERTWPAFKASSSASILIRSTAPSSCVNHATIRKVTLKRQLAVVTWTDHTTLRACARAATTKNST